MSFHSKRESKRSSSSEYESGDGLYGSASSKTGLQLSGERESKHSTMSPKDAAGKPPVEQEKRLRREIANSNERRRMQSINSGFESLKTLIPHTDGEKLSKAAILHQTSDYITALESEKTRLLSQNAKLKRELEGSYGQARDTESDLSSSQGSPPPKRKKRDTESSDEGIGLSLGDFDEPSLEELKREMIYLRCQLDRERRLRMMLEEQTRTLESQLYPERLRQIASQVQAQMRYQEEKQKYLEEQRRIQKEQEEALVARQTLSSAPCSSSANSNSSGAAAAAAITVPPPPPPPSTTVTSTKRSSLPLVNTTASSMSRRNLETIVEAIRHLEGDNMLFDGVKKGASVDEQSADAKSMSMENDSVYAASSSSSSGLASSSERDDCQSDTSGRDSPLSSKDSDVAMAPYAVTASVAATPVLSTPQSHSHHHTSTQVLKSDRFPVASQLLQAQQRRHHSAGRVAHCVPQRPAVIVQNLS